MNNTHPLIISYALSVCPILSPSTSLLSSLCLITPTRRKLRGTPQSASLLASSYFILLKFVTMQDASLGRVRDLAQTGDIKRVIHVHNAPATAAIEAGGLDPWSKEAIFLYWCAFVASICASATGYVSHISMMQLSVF